ncbi:acetolactate synthase 2 small subunit [Thalassotalea agarivorans]|uniref:Acetolactate synthase, small subunit n=1 Tax=Thalassotalea agarivorans TaxID=349064 RepID=A0A1I0E7E6_THASX|nr:acetolactate synthase 2 small subunit [Thalassotalea agarivorans]SET40603.1 acetolactate synthase, small subunit [Thalassotalea agarivorans]
MNSYQLNIQAAQESTVLERILQVSRYRGFDVVGADMTLENSHWQIKLVLESDKCLSKLTTQLQKIVDIEQIERF